MREVSIKIPNLTLGILLAALAGCSSSTTSSSDGASSSDAPSADSSLVLGDSGSAGDAAALFDGGRDGALADAAQSSDSNVGLDGSGSADGSVGTDAMKVTVDFPANVSGVILRAVNSGSATPSFNMRPTGTSIKDDTPTVNIQDECQVQAIDAVNAEHQVDLTLGNLENMAVYYEGYLTDNAVFFTSDPRYRVDVSSGSAGTTDASIATSDGGTSIPWVRVDLSDVPGMPADAKFAIVEMLGHSTRPPLNYYRFRYPGAPDERPERNYSSGHSWSVVPMNANKQFDAYFEDPGFCFLEVVGVITQGQVRTEGGANLAPGSPDGTWKTVDLSLLAPPAGAKYAVIEVFSPSSLAAPYSVRPYGASDHSVYAGNRDSGGFQLFPLTDNKFDIKLPADSPIELYCWGFVTGDAGWHTPVRVSPDAFQPAAIFSTVDLDDALIQ